MTKLTIESVLRHFKEWRASRPKKRKIPDHLWDKVLKLLDYYPTGKVVAALRLSGSQVAMRRKQAKKPPKVLPLTSPVDFVELNTQSIIPGNTSMTSVGSKLELKRPDGAVLILERLSEQMMLQLLNQFARGF